MLQLPAACSSTRAAASSPRSAAARSCTARTRNTPRCACAAAAALLTAHVLHPCPPLARALALLTVHSNGCCLPALIRDPRHVPIFAPFLPITPILPETSPRSLASVIAIQYNASNVLINLHTNKYICKCVDRGLYAKSITRVSNS